MSDKEEGVLGGQRDATSGNKLICSGKNCTICTERKEKIRQKVRECSQ